MYIVGTHLTYLGEALLVSTHSVEFHGKFRFFFFFFCLVPGSKILFYFLRENIVVGPLQRLGEMLLTGTHKKFS